jgi:hypothetical protein
MKKNLLVGLLLVVAAGVTNAQEFNTGWSYTAFTDRMNDKTNHMAVLQSDDVGSDGFNQVVLMCEAGKPDSAVAFFKTTRTYLGRDSIRYAYRLDSGEVTNTVANNSIYNQAVSGDKKGVKVARGTGAIDFAKKLATVKTISTRVANFNGRLYSGNFDNAQVRIEKLQDWISACDAQ